jgi:hypothetical protein
LLFLSAADDACELPTPMPVSGADADADADADEAMPMPMVRPSNRLSKIVASVYRSVGGDNSVWYEQVWGERQRACLLNLEVKSIGGIEMRCFTEYVQYLYWKAISIY